LNDILANWRDIVPMVGLVVLAAAGAFFLFKKKPEDSDELERERRVYLNRVGRIAEGHILEVVDHSETEAHTADAKSEAKTDAKTGTTIEAKGPIGQTGRPKRHAAPQKNGAQKLLYYTYSISGVTYETAQDVTGLEEQAHLKRIAVGQAASVKYDPSNPSNSILLADDWSGLH
jgi:hypothetical protein